MIIILKVYICNLIGQEEYIIGRIVLSVSILCSSTKKQQHLTTVPWKNINLWLCKYVWVRVELVAWQLSWLEHLNGIQWLWVQIPIRINFYSYIYESFSGEYHIYQSIPLHSCNYLYKILIKQTLRLMKAIAEFNSDTEQTMKLE